MFKPTGLEPGLKLLVHKSLGYCEYKKKQGRWPLGLYGPSLPACKLRAKAAIATARISWHKAGIKR